MLRTLLQRKQNLKKSMTALWSLKEKREWSAEERGEYDRHAEAVKRLDSDIKARAEFDAAFEASLPKADLKFQELERKASLVNMLKREVFEVTKNSAFKQDYGQLNEVLQERDNKFPEFAKPGSMYFKPGQSLQKRATITTADATGGDLIQDTLYPGLVKNLFAQGWTGRAGVKMISGWKGKFLLPKENAKPSTGWLAETATYPVSSVSYDNALELSPLKVGTTQKVTLQELLQEEHDVLEASLSSQLLKDFAEKTDDAFLNADGTSNKPKGVLNYSDILSKDSSSMANKGGALTFDLIKDCQTLLENENQLDMPVWLINSKTAGKARKKLRNAVAGADYLMKGGQFGDMRYIMSNIVSSTKQKGTSTMTLSDALLFIPMSYCLIQWAEAQISVDRSNGFFDDTVAFKVSAYINGGVKRPKDFVWLKNLDLTMA